MRKILLLIAICALYATAKAQDISDVGKIPLSIIMPENTEQFDDITLARLQTKMQQIVTMSGFSCDGLTPTFAIVPKLVVNDTKVADGGMQNITMVTAELTLFIQEADNNTSVASMSKELTGNGTTAKAALNNAIASINQNDNDYKTFIRSGKEKIIAYYESRCSNLMTLADNMAAKQDYAGALGILMSVPIEAKSCYTTAQKKSANIYKAYQAKECGSLVITAKAKVAAHEYDDALALLSKVDPLSPCSREANELIMATGNKVDAQQKKEWDAALKIYSDQVALENHRIDAMEEIAVGEYKQKSHRSKKRYQEE